MDHQPSFDFTKFNSNLEEELIKSSFLFHLDNNNNNNNKIRRHSLRHGKEGAAKGEEMAR